jgi:ADP-ribose pyrophosphatase YjhB (NUDIX family)
MSKLPVGGRLPLERYRQGMEDSPIVTVDVLFLDKDKKKILLGKRENAPYAGEFYSFGSRMLKNEEFVDAAIRVAKEELGVPLRPSDLTLVGTINEINETSIFDGINYHAVDIYFYCVIDRASIVLDQQHSETKWFDLDDESIHPNVRTRIEGLKKII